MFAALSGRTEGRIDAHACHARDADLAGGHARPHTSADTHRSLVQLEPRIWLNHAMGRGGSNLPLGLIVAGRLGLFDILAGVNPLGDASRLSISAGLGESM